LPALAVPAVATASADPDPIFEAIERHRRCAAIWEQAVERNEDCEAPAGVTAARFAAFDNLVRIHPTTIPGVIALLDAFVRCKRACFSRRKG
jgi:hypothetical protein